MGLLISTCFASFFSTGLETDWYLKQISYDSMFSKFLWCENTRGFCSFSVIMKFLASSFIFLFFFSFAYNQKHSLQDPHSLSHESSGQLQLFSKIFFPPLIFLTLGHIRRRLVILYGRLQPAGLALIFLC